MGNRVISLLVIALVMCYGLSKAVGYRDEDWGKQREDPDQEQEEQEHEAMMGDEDWFLLGNSKQVVKTKAGEMRVVKSVGGRIVDKPMHIGFITMEPKSLFVPQYMDSSLILFVRSGMQSPFKGLLLKSELCWVSVIFIQVLRYIYIYIRACLRYWMYIIHSFITN